jgi:hypothetical protein
MRTNFSPGRLLRRSGATFSEKLFEHVIRLPPEESVRAAVFELMGHSNRENPPIRAAGLGGRENDVKKLLCIKT